MTTDLHHRPMILHTNNTEGAAAAADRESFCWGFCFRGSGSICCHVVFLRWYKWRDDGTFTKTQCFLYYNTRVVRPRILFTDLKLVEQLQPQLLLLHESRWSSFLSFLCLCSPAVSPDSKERSAKRFSVDGVSNYTSLLLSQEDDMLYVGAREALFALSLSDISKTKLQKNVRIKKKKKLKLLLGFDENCSSTTVRTISFGFRS